MINLHEYDQVIINSSGGKDSVCAQWEVCRLAMEQGYPYEQIIVSHQDLGKAEWGGVRGLVYEQCEQLGVSQVVVVRQRNKDGNNEELLEYVERRGKWPSSNTRYCTSDFKRGPGARVVTAQTKNLVHLPTPVASRYTTADGLKCRVLYVFGFRAQESPARKKRKVLAHNKRLSTKTREVHDWLPIHGWSTKDVWDTIKAHNLPYHKAYDLGMPRLSCVFCIFAPFEALVLAGKENPELLQDYVDVEQRIGHSFTKDFSIKRVQVAVQARAGSMKGKQVIKDWAM